MRDLLSGQLYDVPWWAEDVTIDRFTVAGRGWWRHGTEVVAMLGLLTYNGVAILGRPTSSGTQIRLRVGMTVTRVIGSPNSGRVLFMEVKWHQGPSC